MTRWFSTKVGYAYQEAVKSTTTSFVPALAISDWKCASFSITVAKPIISGKKLEIIQKLKMTTTENDTSKWLTNDR